METIIQKRGHLPLDAIDLGVVNRLRAERKEKIGRTKKPLSEKTRANILNMLAPRCIRAMGPARWVVGESDAA